MLSSFHVAQYGYVANGSVYFDSDAFAHKRRAGRALLDSTLDADASRQQSAQDEELLAEKRRASDFALWKAVPDNEPSWHSPWGKARLFYFLRPVCQRISIIMCKPNAEAS